MDSVIFSLIAHINAGLLCFKDDKQDGIYFEPIKLDLSRCQNNIPHIQYLLILSYEGVLCGNKILSKLLKMLYFLICDWLGLPIPHDNSQWFNTGEEVVLPGLTQASH